MAVFNPGLRGALTVGRVPYALASTVLTDEAVFAYDPTTDTLLVPAVAGGTGTTSDLILQTTTGVGTTGSWMFFKVGNNGAVTAMEINDVGGVGIGTTGLTSVDTALVVRKANPPDIGYVAKFISNLTAYLQIKSGSGANEQAGFSLYQNTNNFEWRVAVIGNDANALRFGGGSGGTDIKATLTQNGNLILDSTNTDPGTGTKALILGDGTVPATLDSNTAGLYANDVNGTVNMFAINESGQSTQLTGHAYTSTATGNIDDLDFNGSKTIIMNNASLATIRGLKAGYDGQEVTISCKNARVDLSHQDTGDATGASRLINFVTVGPTPMVLGSATYVYDGTAARWRLTAHTQGTAITADFDAAEFTANGSMTWTVASGDVGVDSYMIVGKNMFWSFRYSTTSVGGTPNNQLFKTLPDGYSLQVAFDGISYGEDAGTKTTVWHFSSSGQIAFAKLAGGNWTASTDTTRISGAVILSIV